MAATAHGLPALYGEPVCRLVRDVPLRPALLGGLVPHALNVWVGAAREGASSGLHHDHHDNLYVLLRGRKRFRLWSPAWAARMYLHGEVDTVHPNGRIVYKGQVRARPGVDCLDSHLTSPARVEGR